MKKLIEMYQKSSKLTLTPGEAKCPDCGAILEADDHYDTIDDGRYVENLIVGYCPECDTTYQWRNVYLFVGFSELEEVDD